MLGLYKVEKLVYGPPVAGRLCPWGCRSAMCNVFKLLCILYTLSQLYWLLPRNVFFTAITEFIMIINNTHNFLVDQVCNESCCGNTDGLVITFESSTELYNQPLQQKLPYFWKLKNTDRIRTPSYKFSS
jgi:hypothetical protein